MVGANELICRIYFPVPEATWSIGTSRASEALPDFIDWCFHTKTRTVSSKPGHALPVWCVLKMIVDNNDHDTHGDILQE